MSPVGFFFFNDTATTEIYTLSLHDALPISPLDAWRGAGFLPRLPESLEDLDLLLVMHAKARVVRRDGRRDNAPTGVTLPSNMAWRGSRKKNNSLGTPGPLIASAKHSCFTAH